jgi:hypothetical protein
LPATEITPSRKIAVTVTNMNLSTVVFEYGQLTCGEQFARVAGSGKIHAYGHWLRNKDARSAVHFATTMDRKSGGAVKYFRFAGRENNIHETTRFEQLGTRLIMEGFVMPAHTETPVIPIKEAVENNPELAAKVARIQSGEIALESPCGEELQTWTEEAKQSFTRMMQREIGRLYNRGV